MVRIIIAAIAIAVCVGALIWWKTRQRETVFDSDVGSTQEMMDRLAAEAVQLARDSYQITLDYTPESIEKAEGVLAKLHEEYRSGKLSSGVNGLATAFGAYVGEAIRRSEPSAKWERDHPTIGPKSYPLHWRGGESFPCGWCCKRITNGPEDNVWHKYQILKQQRNLPLPSTVPTQGA